LEPFELTVLDAIPMFAGIAGMGFSKIEPFSLTQDNSVSAAIFSVHIFYYHK
jgi:hypothetical protein